MTDFTCPECNGTGVYQGLNTVEPCRACGGKKRIGALVDGLKASTEGFSTALQNATEACRRFAGQSLLHKIEELATEETPSVDLTITYTYFPWPIPQCVLNEPAKPFDEIMPAELEGIKEGDSIKVEIHCEDWTRVFHIFDRIIDRPLFGLPSNSFRFVSFASTPNGEGQKPIVHGTLLYKPLSDADTLTLKNSAGETFWEQKFYTCDPCQDMLFIPILEN